MGIKWREGSLQIKGRVEDLGVRRLAAQVVTVARVGVDVEPDLVRTMVRDVAGQAGGLPLLQYALTELFAGRSSNVIALDAYQELGGVSGALAERAATGSEAGFATAVPGNRILFKELDRGAARIQDRRATEVTI